MLNWIEIWEFPLFRSPDSMSSMNCCRYQVFEEQIDVKGMHTVPLAKFLGPSAPLLVCCCFWDEHKTMSICSGNTESARSLPWSLPPISKPNFVDLPSQNGDCMATSIIAILYSYCLTLSPAGDVAEPDGELAIDGWPSLIGWPLSLCWSVVFWNLPVTTATNTKTRIYMYCSGTGEICCFTKEFWTQMASHSNVIPEIALVLRKFRF